MESLSSELSDDDGMFSSENILQSMGFSTSVIKDAAQKAPLFQELKESASGSSGISKEKRTSVQEDLERSLDGNTISNSSDSISFNSSIFNDVSLTTFGLIGEVPDLGLPIVTSEVVDIPMIETLKRNDDIPPTPIRRKKMRIYEDYFSSSDESNPDDPDYVPNLLDIKEQPRYSQTAQPLLEINNGHGIEVNNEEEKNQPAPVNVDGDFTEEQNNLTQNNDEETLEQENRPTKVRNKDNKHNWSKNVNYEKRQKGEAYMGYRRCGGGKTAHNIPREAKVLGPRCDSRSCMRSKLRAYASITEEERQKIFNSFWKSMTWDQRKVYIVSLLEKVTIARRRTTAPENSRRTETLRYYLVIGNERQQVCQRTFLNTFGIKKWSIRYWLNGEGRGTEIPSVNDTKIVPSSTITCGSKRGQPRKREEFLKNYLKALPKVPSHYCRSSSTKLYLEPTFDSLTELYESYGDECKTSGNTILSRFTFDKTFQKENLSLFQPKKDVCDMCNSYKVKSGTVSKEEYEKHIIEKDRAKTEKENDVKKGEAKEVHVFTQDTQAVKLAPCINASAMYYKTKLCVHNFTMYNNATKDAITYWWDETQSDLSANSFASCVVDNLRQTLATDLKPVILWSDGCCYQNRSSTMSNALLHLAKEHNIDIEQKFLVKGHTMMECDSVHSTIDTILNPKRGTKNKKTVKEIYLPSQYAQLSREARKKPFPYRSMDLDFTFFRDFSKKEDLVYESIRPGKRVGDPKATDLRALKYKPDGTIEYKISFDNTYSSLPLRPKKKIESDDFDFPHLNNARQKIKKSKWDHLQELKSHIPRDCHDYYDNIPFEN